MMSFNYAITPAHGNCFQTNQLEHESDDCESNTETSVSVTIEKAMVLERQIRSTFVTG